MYILFHKNFEKKYRKLNIKLQRQADERINLFQRDPFDKLLNNHSLQGVYKDFRSINITGDFRAFYKVINRNTIEFVDLDTHSNFYS